MATLHRLAFIAVLLSASCTEPNPQSCASSGCPSGSTCVHLKDGEGRSFSRCVTDDVGGTGDDVDAAASADSSRPSSDVAIADLGVSLPPDAAASIDVAVAPPTPDAAADRSADAATTVDATPDAAPVVYTFGAVLSATGPLASIGQLQSVDDASNATMGRAAAKALVQAHVPVIFGPLITSATLAIAQDTVPAKIFLLSPSASSVDVATLDDQGYVACTCGSDADEGKLLARRSSERGHMRAAIIHESSNYGMLLAGAFATRFTNLGGVVTSNIVVTPGQSSYSAALNDVFANNPQEVFLIAEDSIDAGQVILDYLAGFSDKGTFWEFNDTLGDPTFVSKVGAAKFTFAHEGARTTATVPSTPKFVAFTAAFQNRYGHAPGGGTVSAAAYDSVFLVALAAEAAGSVDGTAVRDKITAVSLGGTKYGPTEYKMAAQAAREGRDIDFEGASGPTDFDANGNVTSPYDVWKILTNGAVVTQESSVLP